MNSVQNSDSDQCPESKLGWVHRMHTQGLGCALSRPCCGAPGVVLQASPDRNLAFLLAVSQRAPAVSQAVSRTRAHCYASCRSLLDRVALLPAVSWRIPGRVAALYRDTTSDQAFLLSRYKRHPHQPGLLPVTIQLIVS